MPENTERNPWPPGTFGHAAWELRAELTKAAERICRPILTCWWLLWPIVGFAVGGVLLSCILTITEPSR